MIEVCAMKLSGIRNREEYLYGEADRQRRTKALRFIRADDRLRCLAAGYLMKRCLPGYREEASRLEKSRTCTSQITASL